MKKILIATLMSMTFAFVSTKKAEAAIIVNPAFGLVAGGAGVVSIVLLAEQIDGAGWVVAAAVGLILLDESEPKALAESISKTYKSIPSYVTQEIVGLVEHRLKDAVPMANGLKKVVLDEEEIAEIEDLIPDSANKKEVKELIKILGTDFKA